MPDRQLTPQQQQTCYEIMTMLDMARGFELMFIECNSPALQQRVEDYLAEHSLHNWIRIVFEQEIRNVREELLERELEAQAKSVISIRGLEHSIHSNKEAADVVARLNVARDVLPKYFSCPVLLWLPLYALQNFARFAPDLWSWRTGVFSFEPPEPQTQETLSNEMKPARGTTSVDNYSKAFKEAEIKFLTPILEAFDANSAAPPQLRKHVENAFLLAEYHYSLGNYQEAFTWLKQAKACYQQLEDNGRIAECHRFIGIIYQKQGDYQRASREYETSLRMFEKLGDQDGIAKTRRKLGDIHCLRGDYDTALHEYEASLRIFEELGDQTGIAIMRHQFGMLHQARNEYKVALREYEDSLRLKEELGHQAGIAATRHNIGIIHQQRGEYDAALREYEASLRIYEELGKQHGIATSKGNIANIHEQRKDYSAAFDGYFYALTVLRQLQSPGARVAVNYLRRLRNTWGADAFDAAWQQAAGEPVPDEMKE